MMLCDTTKLHVRRKERVSHLIFPLCTVLDDSIGCAFWFAARGQGSLYSGTIDASVLSPTHYKSQARVCELCLCQIMEMGEGGGGRGRGEGGECKCPKDSVFSCIMKVS